MNSVLTAVLKYISCMVFLHALVKFDRDRYQQHAVRSLLWWTLLSYWYIKQGSFISLFFIAGHTEPVHCISMYKHQVITATTGNKIGVHSSPNYQGSFTSMKLRSDTFKGVLTSMAVLPLNRMLLLGADNGSIRLFC